MMTYAGVCWRILTYADECLPQVSARSERQDGSEKREEAPPGDAKKKGKSDTLSATQAGTPKVRPPAKPKPETVAALH